MVTVTTPALAAVYAQYNQRVKVLPNQMVPADWQAIERIAHPGELWVGWTGSGTHYDDLKLAAAGITQALERLPHAKLVLAGSPQMAHYLFSEVEQRGQAITFPWTTLEAYRKYLASFDIVLAPSADNAFNASKSDIRVLEAGMVQRPVVGSVATYGPTIQASRGGLTARSTSDWMHAILKLANNADLRAAMAANLSSYANTRTYAAHAPLWHAAYTELLNDAKSNQPSRVHALYV